MHKIWSILIHIISYNSIIFNYHIISYNIYQWLSLNDMFCSQFVPHRLQPIAPAKMVGPVRRLKIRSFCSFLPRRVQRRATCSGDIHRRPVHTFDGAEKVTSIWYKWCELWYGGVGRGELMSPLVTLVLLQSSNFCWSNSQIPIC